jgi:hypothetical protein
LIKRGLHIFVLSIFCCSGLAAQAPADTNMHTKETSIVTISAEPIIWRVAPTVSGGVIYEEEIVQRSPEDLGDLSSSFAGVFVRSYGGAGGLKTMNARGLGSQHFLVVSNSQSMLYNQMGSANLGDVQVDGLRYVSYSVGGTDSWRLPALSKTYSGVLALHYKDNPLYLSKINSAQVQALGASFGRAKISGLWLKSTDKCALFAQAYGYRLDGDYPFEFQHGLIAVDGERLHNKTREAAFRLGGVRQINSKNLIHISTQYLNAHRELPGAIVFYHPDYFQELANQQFNWNINHDRLGEKVSFLNYANYSWTKTDYSDQFTLFGNARQIYNERNFDVGHNGTLNLKKLQINWSGQYVFSDLITNRADILLPKRQRGIVNVGGIYGWRKIKIRADLPFQFLSDQLAFHPNQNRLLFTPSLGLNKYWSNDKYTTFVRASAGQFARVATFSEMYYGQMGNPELLPEISQMINLGIHHDRKLKKMYLAYGIDAFAGHVKDKIIAIPTQNLFVWSVRNVQTVRTYGFDAVFNLSYNLSDASKIKTVLKSSLNVAHDMSDANSATFRQQIPYTPYWLHSAELTYKLKGFSITYQYSFNDFRFVLGENIAANVLDEFHLHDIRVNYESKIKNESKHGYRVHAKCNNLLNTQYQVMRGFPMPGVNFEVGFTWLWK